jgi:toxin ParE1/3/4
VAQYGSIENADRLLDKIEETIIKLSTIPTRGHIPPELERIGVLEFREVFFKPYRIIYQVIKSNVYVHCVLDGRRDLQDLLQQRVLR